MSKTDTHAPTQWFAIKTLQDFKAELALASRCEDVFFPTNVTRLPSGRAKRKAVIPHVLFIKTTRKNALRMEREGRMSPVDSIPFWIFRYPKDPDVQVISQRSIDLLRLLTADDTTECRVYTPTVFRPGDEVRIIGGLFEGYEGFVKRINRDRHVIVEIEGVCMVILPFIHPDLLIKKKDNLSITGKTIDQVRAPAASSSVSP